MCNHCFKFIYFVNNICHSYCISLKVICCNKTYAIMFDYLFKIGYVIVQIVVKHKQFCEKKK